MILKESGDTKYRDFRRFGGQKINEVWEQKTRKNTYVCILYHCRCYHRSSEYAGCSGRTGTKRTEDGLFYVY